MRELALTALAALALSACATTPTAPDIAQTQNSQPAPLTQFEPQPDGRITAIDYEVIDAFLSVAVVNLGPSTRQLARPATNPVNTRVKIGHQSRLRLEGNKVLFSQMGPRTDARVREYADSLETIGNDIDITKLPRNSQLAYWFNLHNMVAIATLAEEYPVQKPRELKIDGVPFHDAKLVTIRGQALSLRDIRTRIVYPYWNDPRVIYGFFHGDLAGPSMRSSTWEPATINRSLSSNTREFVNSLRGVNKSGRDTLLVSSIYEEARPFFFRSWEADLKDHLLRFADPDVVALIEERDSIKYSVYEDTIADLAGGRAYRELSPNEDNTLDGVFTQNYKDWRMLNLPPAMDDMIREINRKFESVTFRDRVKSRVTIVDGEDVPDAEVE